MSDALMSFQLKQSNKLREEEKDEKDLSSGSNIFFGVVVFRGHTGKGGFPRNFLLELGHQY
jgi:hypothetical protein